MSDGMEGSHALTQREREKALPSFLVCNRVRGRKDTIFVLYRTVGVEQPAKGREGRVIYAVSEFVGRSPGNAIDLHEDAVNGPAEFAAVG